jgi:hypothetical protein
MRFNMVSAGVVALGLLAGLAAAQPLPAPAIHQPLAPSPTPTTQPASTPQLSPAPKSPVESATPPGTQPTHIPSKTDAPDIPTRIAQDPEIKAAWKVWTKDWIESNRWDLQEHKRAFSSSTTMGLVVGAAVHVILAVALGMAILEFRSASHIRRRTRRTSATGEAADPESHLQLQEIQIKADGIALKTSLHGTILLAFALAFYFLYIKFVLPVTIVG